MKPAPPSLETARLRLRLVSWDDAERIEELASDPEIADTMISIPHPYPAGEAGRWIADTRSAFAAGRGVPLAIERLCDGLLVGVLEIRAIEREHSQAELSFWIGVPYWGRGYAAEAVAAAVRHGFEQLELNRLYAHHMVRNPASARVLERVGFAQEGLLRARVWKSGVAEDVVLRAMLRADWRDIQASTRRS